MNLFASFIEVYILKKNTKTYIFQSLFFKLKLDKQYVCMNSLIIHLCFVKLNITITIYILKVAFLKMSFKIMYELRRRPII